MLPAIYALSMSWENEVRVILGDFFLYFFTSQIFSLSFQKSVSQLVLQ